MSNSNSGGGIGIGGILLIVFIVLKLCGVIAWSWWWGLKPIMDSDSLMVGYCCNCRNI